MYYICETQAYYNVIFTIKTTGMKLLFCGGYNKPQINLKMELQIVYSKSLAMLWLYCILFTCHPSIHKKPHENKAINNIYFTFRLLHSFHHNSLHTSIGGLRA